MGFALPPGALIPNVSWPGITNGVRSFQYDCIHGITPNTALIVTNPQPKPPASFGKLFWSDGKRGHALNECKLARMTPSIGPGGYIFTLEILDRRWQWANGTFPNGGGKYNQVDPNGKLIPWTIRNPTELALLCLQAMQVKQFHIEGLPRGLGTRDARRVTKYLETGQNYPLTAANPPVNWEGIPPAIALVELCERYGCRPIFQPGQDRLLIQRLGIGYPLTSGGSLTQASVSVESPETPIAVGIYGAASQHQGRFAIEPVGQEWDGKRHFVPIRLLSYAPTLSTTSQFQITNCEVRPTGDAATASLSAIVNGFGFVATGLSNLVNLMNANQTFRNLGITCVLSSSAVMTLTGTKPESFSVQCVLTGGSTDRSRFDARITQPHKNKLIADWSKLRPPYYGGINATDRLAKIEALALANGTVWRCYRFMDEDVEFAHENARLRSQGIKAPYKPIIVPGYGPLLDRRQIVPCAEMVEQITPTARELNGRYKDALVGGQLKSGGILPEYYDGYSKNQIARVYGQYSKAIGSVYWNTKAGLNTDPMARVKVEFHIDPFTQVVTFAEPIYRFADQGGQSVLVDPELILECAVTVRDPVTWSERRPQYVRAIPGGVALPEFLIKEDVIANFIGEYDDRNHIKKVTQPPEDADGPLRAEEYVRGMAAKYQLKASQVQTWNGIVPIEPDGLVHQVKWEIGPNGIYTMAGTNSEFSTYLPSYPARRQRENLAANPNAALSNIADQNPAALPASKIGGAVASALALR